MDRTETNKIRIRIYNRSGINIAEIRAAVEMSWALGMEGRATITLPSRQTDYVNEDIIQYGNYVLIENSKLPAWVGVIDTPREWTAQTVTVNCYGPERIFAWRRGIPDFKLTGTASNIFATLIQYINYQESTLLRVGNLTGGSVQRQETLTAATINNNLRQIRDRSNEDYFWRPVVTATGLTIYGDWLERAGTPTPLTLTESSRGGNIEKPTMNEDGIIINDIFGYGDGLTWKTKPQVINTDTTSQNTYGLRQYSQEWYGASTAGTVEANNKNILNKSSSPRKIFDLTALNVGSTFDYLQIGNTVGIQLSSLGFIGKQRGTITTARIVGMSYNPTMGQKVRLVLQEVT